MAYNTTQRMQESSELPVGRVRDESIGRHGNVARVLWTDCEMSTLVHWALDRTSYLLSGRKDASTQFRIVQTRDRGSPLPSSLALGRFCATMPSAPPVLQTVQHRVVRARAMQPFRQALPAEAVRVPVHQV